MTDSGRQLVDSKGAQGKGRSKKTKGQSTSNYGGRERERKRGQVRVDAAKRSVQQVIEADEAEPKPHPRVPSPQDSQQARLGSSGFSARRRKRKARKLRRCTYRVSYPPDHSSTGLANGRRRLTMLADGPPSAVQGRASKRLHHRALTSRASASAQAREKPLYCQSALSRRQQGLLLYLRRCSGPNGSDTSLTNGQVYGIHDPPVAVSLFCVLQCFLMFCSSLIRKRPLLFVSQLREG